MRDVAINELKEGLGGLLVIVVDLLAMRDNFSDALIKHPIASLQSNRLAGVTFLHFRADVGVEQQQEASFDLEH